MQTENRESTVTLERTIFNLEPLKGLTAKEIYFAFEHRRS